ncbi:hypothetical protein [Pontibacillus yanchengensis]|uniref:Uncharacterized protein n=1 Tax=Pontibacillus yanchengensis Y32 TaxID=1385514 RepID=A0A0A2TZ28_9BACI|nr:hypothetical protein [Pontibacillus yanchengensis]KGP74525.1 hypothetical protein N782_12755 [Pontibacillus yanchengensis Y32]
MKTASVNMAVFRLCYHRWLKQILTVAAVAILMLCLSLADDQGTKGRLIKRLINLISNNPIVSKKAVEG